MTTTVVRPLTLIIWITWATLTDKMVDVSDDLADDALTDDVKKFAKEAKRHNKQFRDRAKQSKNALD